MCELDFQLVWSIVEFKILNGLTIIKPFSEVSGVNGKEVLMNHKVSVAFDGRVLDIDLHVVTGHC